MPWCVAASERFRELGQSVADALAGRIADVSIRSFPDGESKITISDDFRGKRVIVIQSTSPPVDSNLIQLLFLCHRLSEEGAEVHACVPYLGYSRQDKEFLPGEVVSLGVVSHLLRSVGVRRLLTVDIHSAQGLGLFSFPAYSTSAIPMLARYASSMELERPICVSPDAGAETRAQAFAELIKTDSIAFQKERDRKTGEIMMTRTNLDFTGRDTIIVDDIISTGGSIAKTAELARDLGARNIYAFCVHALMLGDAKQRLKGAGVVRVISTNTIPESDWSVDVSPAIVSYFKSLN